MDARIVIQHRKSSVEFILSSIARKGQCHNTYAHGITAFYRTVFILYVVMAIAYSQNSDGRRYALSFKRFNVMCHFLAERLYHRCALQDLGH